MRYKRAPSPIRLPTSTASGNCDRANASTAGMVNPALQQQFSVSQTRLSTGCSSPAPLLRSSSLKGKGMSSSDLGGLGDLTGAHESDAEGINDEGHVVGQSSGGRVSSLKPPSGAAAISSRWEACPAPNKQMLIASITLDKRWDTASSFQRPRPCP